MNKQEGLSPGKKKTLMALGWLAAILVVIGAPFGITAHHFHTIYHTTDQTLLVLARLSGLMAMSLIFMEIVTGSFRPLLVKIYPRAALHRAHITFGIAGLAFVISHFLLLVPDLAERWREANKVLFIAGPVALALLIVTVLTALYARRFKGSWRWLHLINYPIFIIAVAHNIVIGTDRTMLALQLLSYGFVVVTLAGLAYRVRQPEWRAMYGKKKGGRA